MKHLVWLQAHPFFAGVDWDNLYNTKAPYVPVVEHELDTQNFEQFEDELSRAEGSGGRRRAKADPNFIGYTYKNWEAVQPSESKPQNPINTCQNPVKTI